MNTTVLERWNRWWFTAEGPTNLACCRIAFFGMMLFFYAGQRFAPWGEAPEALWMPATILGRIGVGPASPEILGGLGLVWKIALACACAGLASRFTTAVSFLIGFYLLDIPHNFGKVNHHDGVLVLTMFILSLSRCGSILSLDQIIRSRWNRLAEVPPPSAEFRWPIRAVWVILALVLGAAGVAKFYQGGWGWFTPDNMAINLISHNYGGATPLTDWGLRVATIPWICQIMSLGGALVELLFPLALFFRKLRLFLLLATLVLFIGIRVLLGPSFEHYLMLYLFFIPWSKFGNFLLTVIRKNSTRAPRLPA